MHVRKSSGSRFATITEAKLPRSGATLLTVLYFLIFCRLRRTRRVRRVRHDRRGPTFRCSPGRKRLTPGGARVGYGAGGRRGPASHRSALVTATAPREPTLPGHLVATRGSRTTRARAWTASLRAGGGHRQRHTLGPAAARWPKFAAPAGGRLRRGARHPMRLREQVIGTLNLAERLRRTPDEAFIILCQRPQPLADRTGRRRRPRHGPHHHDREA